MANPPDEEAFTFSWLALKLLGRGLYSNPWSALSELVANGLDAGARTVYVYIDVRNRSDAVVEVLDDGSGMSRTDISTYVKVGHNKRLEPVGPADEIDSRPKGRKGIGKLAALYLSQHFYLQTRFGGTTTSWQLDARAENIQDDEHPRLQGVEDVPETANDDLWQRFSSGTRLILTEVDLTGYGPQSISALGSRLANQFLLPVSGSPRIELWVRTSDAEVSPEYSPVEKTVAFRNFAEVLQNFPDRSIRPPELSDSERSLTIPAPGLPGEEYEHVPVFRPFPPSIPDDEAWNSIADLVDEVKREYRGIRYSLTGWIGVHATIKNEAARKNDDRFVKNRYYNPAQIRVYVRGKLASDRLLSQLGLTGTYVNYIEGEVSFDILDDDGLDDIATSNRQDFDETDGRLILLKAIVRPLVRTLMQSRNALASAITSLTEEEQDRRDSASKRNFSEQLRSDLEYYPEIPLETRDELQSVITNKIQGDVFPKQKYRVFISHAKKDRAFASFVDEVLQSRGAHPYEIFYTSRVGSVEHALDERALREVIRESITDSNTLIFYMTSRNFLDSQFCLFEGGAGWATRGVSEYLKLNMEFESIPAFLTNGRAEMTMIAGQSIELSLELNNYIIQGVLNPMIKHLNRGREIDGDASIDLFEIQALPSLLDLAKAGETPESYREPMLVEHWDTLVAPGVDEYLSGYGPI